MNTIILWIACLGNWLLFEGTLIQAMIELKDTSEKVKLLRARGWTIVSWGAWLSALAVGR
ncbi:hypothetical protein [Lactococcus protaetiae]|uniref:Uncharacterized protein n=1 Tax=Lactococcus protaetiae TaxID=2592653 RepID=A0A514Z8Y0_9LACT|nr:hypothetical protein [Lactococcus protaetiae]QDK71032.1 hypothetical protein FLP15_07510 [Lactococcus protaetiae]